MSTPEGRTPAGGRGAGDGSLGPGGEPPVGRPATEGLVGEGVEPPPVAEPFTREEAPPPWPIVHNGSPYSFAVRTTAWTCSVVVGATAAE